MEEDDLVTRLRHRAYVLSAADILHPNWSEDWWLLREAADRIECLQRRIDACDETLTRGLERMARRGGRHAD